MNSTQPRAISTNTSDLGLLRFIFSIFTYVLSAEIFRIISDHLFLLFVDLFLSVDFPRNVFHKLNFSFRYRYTRLHGNVSNSTPSTQVCFFFYSLDSCLQTSLAQIFLQIELLFYAIKRIAFTLRVDATFRRTFPRSPRYATFQLLHM